MPDNFPEIKNPQYIPLSKAGEFLGTSRDYMNVLVRRGKLRAVKLGRNWFTTSEWLDEYRKPTVSVSEASLAQAERDELNELKTQLALEKESKIEKSAFRNFEISKKTAAFIASQEIELPARKLEAGEKSKILEAANEQIKLNDAARLQTDSEWIGASKTLSNWQGAKFFLTSGIVIVALAAVVGFSISEFSAKGGPASGWKNLNSLKYQATLFSDSWKDFSNDLPAFSNWLASGVDKTIAFLKPKKQSSELTADDLKPAESKIAAPGESFPSVNTLADAEALDSPGEISSEIATGQGSAQRAGNVGTGTGNNRFAVIENRLSIVETTLTEQSSLVNAELSIQKKTILGALDAIFGIAQFTPAYPLSTMVVQGSPASLTTYAVAPQVQSGFDRLSASYLSLASNAEINGSLTVKSGATLNSLSVTTDAAILGNATIGGNLTLTGTLSAPNSQFNLYSASSTYATLTNLWATNATIDNLTQTNASTTYLTVSDTSWINKLAVTGAATSTFNNPITSFSGNFIVAADSANNLLLNPYGGNVGIGTTTPGSLFSVHSTGNTYLGGDLTVSGNSNFANLSTFANASTTNGTITNFWATNGTITNASTTYATIPTFWGTTGNITELTITNATTTRLMATNSTLTNASSTYLTVANDLWGNRSDFSTSVKSPLFWNSGTLTASTTGANPIVFATNSSERMRIDESGNVGIGTSSPNGLFAVAGTGNVIFNNTGNIGIGTTTPGSLFSVHSTGNTYLGGDLTVSGNSNFANLSTFANASTTNGTITNFWSTNGTITNASSTYGTVSTLWSDLATVSELNFTNATGTRLFVTNSTLTNASTTYLTVANDLWGNRSDFSTSVKSPLFWNSGTLTASTTGSNPIVFATNSSERMRIDEIGRILIATTTIPSGYGFNVATSTFTYGNQFISGGLGVGVATTTNGVIQTSGNVSVGGNLYVSGDSTIIGASSADTLSVNSSINSNLIPDQNITRDLGSTSFYWKNAYIGNLTMNSVSAASTTIGGTQSETFTINSDNATADNETETLIFFRGTVVPNALLTWNSATSSKRFEFNQATYINDGNASTTNPTFTIQSVANQTANALQILDNNSSPYFSVNPFGSNTTMVNASTTYATIPTFWSSNANITGGTITGITDLTVADGGTGASTLTDHGVLIGSGTDAITALSVGTNGQILVGSTGADPVFATLNCANGLTCTTGAGTLQVDFDGGDSPAGELGGTWASPTIDDLFILNTGDIGTGTYTFPELNFTNATGTRLFATNGTITNASTTYATVSNNLWGDISKFSTSVQSPLFWNSGTLTASTTGVNPIVFATNSSERMRIDENGKIGIGTTTGLWARTTIDGGGSTSATAALSVINSASTSLLFVRNDGNVGIGTTTPGSLFSVHSSGSTYLGGDLTVSGTANFTGSSFTSVNASSTYLTATNFWSTNGTITNASTTYATIPTFWSSNANITGGTITGITDLTVADGGTGASTLTGFVYGNGANPFTATTTPYFGTGFSANMASTTYLTVSDTAWINNLVATNATTTTFRSSGLATFGGNVGIGTTTPGSALMVANGRLKVTGNTTPTTGAGVEIGYDGTQGIILTYDRYAGAYKDLGLGSGGTQLYLPAAGNVGIGTTGPNDLLDVNGAIRFGAGTYSAGVAKLYSDATYGTILTGKNGSVSDMLLTDDAGNIAMQIYTNVTTPNVIFNGGGNVGIGTTGPTNKLDIIAASANQGVDVRVGSSGGTLRILNPGVDNTVVMGAVANNDVQFITNNANVMRLTTAGNVGIGTTSPSQKLDIYSTSGLAGATLNIQSTVADSYPGIFIKNDAQEWHINTDGSAGDSLVFYDATGSTGYRMVIQPDGNVGIGTTGPGATLHVSSANSAFSSYTNHGNLFVSSNDAMAINKGGTLALGGLGDGSNIDDFVKIHGKKENATSGNVSGYLAIEVADNTTSPYMFERMRITSTGNVGIGTTAPGANLDIQRVAGDSSDIFRIGSNQGYYFGFARSDSTGALSIQGSQVGNNNIVLAPTSGNVGIGTTSPSVKLSIVGSSEPQVQITDGTNSLVQLRSSANASAINFHRQQSGGTEANIGMSVAGSAGLIDDLVFSLHNGTSWSERMRILNNGNVGIGTTTPTTNLTISTAGSTANVAVPNGWLCVDNDGGCIGGTAGRIYYVAAVVGNSDIAENYRSEEKLEAGEIVQIKQFSISNSQFSINDSNSNFQIEKATSTSQTIIGIISTAPGNLLGYDVETASTSYPVALSGRVPVKVSLENGPIAVGDRISASSVAGVGKKAAAGEATVGMALEEFSSANSQFSNNENCNIGNSLEIENCKLKIGKIMVFVSLGSPNLAAAQGTGELNQFNELNRFNQDVNINGFSLLNVKSITGMNGLWRIDENGNITAQSVETQRLTVGGGNASGITIYDRQTSAPKCIYIEGGAIMSSDGACGSTANTGAEAVISPPTGDHPQGDNDQIPMTNQIPNPNDQTNAIATSTEQIIEILPISTTTPEIITASEPVTTATTTP